MNKFLLNLFLANLFLLLADTALAQSRTFDLSIVSDGKVWLQPGLFSSFPGISWTDIDVVCPAPERLCNGIIVEKDISGFTWASKSDVEELLTSYEVPLGLLEGAGIIDAPWAMPFFDDFFAINAPDWRAVSGWVSDISPDSKTPQAIYVIDNTSGDSFPGDFGDPLVDALWDAAAVYETESASEVQIQPHPWSNLLIGTGIWLYAPADELFGPTFQVSLEEPVEAGISVGIGNLRGWAVSSDDIDRIEVYINGKYMFDAPYGGDRPDVEAAFPAVGNSRQSGFSLAYGYSNLGPGEHSITVRAINGIGESVERTSNFTVVAFDEIFIGPNELVSTVDAEFSAEGDEIFVSDVRIGERLYDLTLSWDTASQGFKIVEIR